MGLFGLSSIYMLIFRGLSRPSFHWCRINNCFIKRFQFSTTRRLKKILDPDFCVCDIGQLPVSNALLNTEMIPFFDDASSLQQNRCSIWCHARWMDGWMDGRSCMLADRYNFKCFNVSIFVAHLLSYSSNISSLFLHKSRSYSTAWRNGMAGRWTIIWTYTGHPSPNTETMHSCLNADRLTYLVYIYIYI